MNARLVNSAAEVINAALSRCQTATGIAIALDSVQLLLTPETAAELERLRGRVTELESSPLAWAERLDLKSLDNFLTVLASAAEYEPMDGALPRVNEVIASFRVAVEAHGRREAEADGITRATAPRQAHTVSDPIPLRWGLNDVEWGDDDTTRVLLSGPEREPYYLELEPDQAAVLRDDLAGPDGPLVFRASHDSIAMGLYTTAAEARKHCEAEERRSWPTGTNLSFDWIEDEEDGVDELVVVAGQNEESTTGYVVTALEVASEYDEGADE